jgi:hypothetical protein
VSVQYWSVVQLSSCRSSLVQAAKLAMPSACTTAPTQVCSVSIGPAGCTDFTLLLPVSLPDGMARRRSTESTRRIGGRCQAWTPTKHRSTHRPEAPLTVSAGIQRSSSARWFLPLPGVCDRLNECTTESALCGVAFPTCGGDRAYVSVSWRKSGYTAGSTRRP